MRTLSALIGALAIAFPIVGQVHAQSSGPKSFIWKQCNEDVLLLQVDPSPLQPYVDSAFSMVLEAGRARVLIVVQDCPTYWFDGTEIGPTQEVHMWVTVEAPADVRPVTGAERTLPTMTWFNLFTGSSSARARAAWIASGTPSLTIERVALDPRGPRRGGRVSVDGDLRYSWDGESAPPFARLVGVNHDVYGKASAGDIV